MAKGASKLAADVGEGQEIAGEYRRAGVLGLYSAECRVLGIQARLHRWAKDDPHRRFDDLFNLVADSAFLLVLWDRVRGHKRTRSDGVDAEAARYIEAARGVQGFLADLRADLRARTFRPLPVPRRAIPRRAASSATWGSLEYRSRGTVITAGPASVTTVEITVP